jgi:hypothetical protein
MTPDQKRNEDPVSARDEPRPEASPAESAPGLPDDDRPNKSADCDRRGWRAYFPAAARKELKAEAVDDEGSKAVISRLTKALSP